MNYKKAMILFAKKRYTSGVPFEKVIDEVLERALVDFQLFFTMQVVQDIMEVSKMEKEREKDEKRNN